MNPRHRILAPSRSALRGGLVRAALGIACLGPGVAEADGRTLSGGAVGGALAVDSALADYRWDTGPSPVWGLAVRLAGDRLAGGLRVWRARTTQATGIPGESAAPEVKITGTEAVGSFRVASLAGVRLAASVSVGTLHLGWSPDRVTLPPLGAGDPIEVRFAPVTEWIGGVGVAAQRSLFGGLDLALGIERSWFRLDTAHRAGTEIVAGRDTFGNWMLRMQLSHRVLQL